MHPQKLIYTEEEFLPLSGIQHYSFCRRQWALIHIEQQWKDNALTAEGTLIHERVHDPDKTDIRDGILTVRALPIKSYSLGFSGECDAVEFAPSPDGITLKDRDGYWLPTPVEYKHGKSKTNDCDRLQVCAQAMCLEEMFGCHTDKAFLFYHETRRREVVTLTHELRAKVKDIADDMHRMYTKSHTPKVKTNKGCAKCSLADICLPILLKNESERSIDSYIRKALGGLEQI